MKFTTKRYTPHLDYVAAKNVNVNMNISLEVIVICEQLPYLGVECFVTAKTFLSKFYIIFVSVHLRAPSVPARAQSFPKVGTCAHPCPMVTAPLCQWTRMHVSSVAPDAY